MIKSQSFFHTTKRLCFILGVSCSDISSLSGYLISQHGKSIIFSIINGVNKPISKAKAPEEQILSVIEEEINGDSPPSSEFA